MHHRDYTRGPHHRRPGLLRARSGRPALSNGGAVEEEGALSPSSSEQGRGRRRAWRRRQTSSSSVMAAARELQGLPCRRYCCSPSGPRATPPPGAHSAAGSLGRTSLEKHLKELLELELALRKRFRELLVADITKCTHGYTNKKQKNGLGLRISQTRKKHIPLY
jgi:hypothetical protein